MTATGMFGPQTQLVIAFLAELENIPWFSRVGEAADRDSDLIRADIHFLLATASMVSGTDTDQYLHWGNCLAAAESKLDRLILEHARMDDEAALRKALRIPAEALDHFYSRLTEQFQGYYLDTCSYVYELVDPPMRLISGAALETMLSDLDPELNFFRNLMPFFKDGFWPCGWQGTFPDGKLILW